jgi:parallel beta helix pectate lyase-like protein
MAKLPVAAATVAAFALAIMLVVPAPSTAESDDILVGSLPSDGGFALVTWTAGSAVDLVAAAEEQGCVPTSVWVFVVGFPIGYFVDAPEFVNEPFLRIHPAAVARDTLAVVVCRTIVVLEPGDDISAIEALHPPGTLYRLLPGTFREQSLTPKDRDTYIGEDGAVLSGARILTGFEPVAGFWSVGGQTSELFGNGVCSRFQGQAYTGCIHPEQLFIDGERLWQVTNSATLTTGQWYFDYAADRIYLAENPQGRTVELSVIPTAVASDAVGVTISNLVIEKYANRAQTGALQGSRTTNWTVENNEFRYNHGTGLRIGDGMVVRGNSFHYMGQLGLGGVGDNVLIEQNEIANNGLSGFDSGWEGGGTKFVKTRNLVIRDNYVHDNRGRGIWTDINNVDVLIELNLVESNTAGGIVHEISYAAVIRNNTSRYNGLGFDVWLWGSQILVQNSSDVLVTGNTVVVAAEGGNGIGIVNQDRPGGDSTLGPWVSQRITVQGNDVTFLGSTGASGIADDTGTSFACGSGSENLFDGNAYQLLDADSTRWEWCGGRTWAALQALGVEASGSITVGSP